MRQVRRVAGVLAIPIVLAVLTACQAGYGIKIGYQKKLIRHTGYTSDQIFTAAEDALQELGHVTKADRETGVIEGEIPPYAVEATVTKDSPWLKLVGRENERGLWKRDRSKSQWFLSIDGRLYYRVGAADLKDAVRQWSRAINKRIP